MFIIISILFMEDELGPVVKSDLEERGTGSPHAGVICSRQRNAWNDLGRIATT
jgi:hypothetical protein